jgi:hypothetical protein
MNLDELLASLQSAAADDTAQLPLIDAQNFVDAAPAAGALSRSASHTYVGCIGRWLCAKNALLCQHTIGMSIENRLLSPADFSQQVLRGKLSATDVVDEFRGFAIKYVRDLGVYGRDYEDTLVAPVMKRSMFEVESTEATYEAIAPVIESRYLRFVEGDANWALVETGYRAVELTENEKNTDDWVTAFRRTFERDTLPEKQRREELNRFWALVDYAPNVADNQVVNLLLTTFSRSSDSSVQQSVLNALATMPFEMVMPEVLTLASWLADTGWLPEILGCWQGDFTDQQINLLNEMLDSTSAEARNLVNRAARLPDYHRARWALAIQRL